MSDDRTPVIRRTGSVFPRGRSEAPRGSLAGTDYGVAGGSPTPYKSTPIPAWATSGGTDQEKKAAADKKRQQQKKSADNTRLQQQMHEGYAQQMYVDGRLSTVYNLYDADGKPVQIQTFGGYTNDKRAGDLGLASMTPGQRSEYEGDAKNRATTFSVLGLADLQDQQTSTFIMGRGDPINSQGQTFYDTEAGRNIAEQNLVKHRPNIDAQGRPLNRNQSATNMMTVAGGVTWFKQLAQKDPAAYDEMIKLLIDSKYLSKDQARTGVYTVDAGRAFAYAARDAAENVSAGSQDDLRTFLGKVATSAQQNNPDFTPADRTYADPAALAQKARAAAQEALGRALSPEEEARFEASFRGKEDAFYDQIDAAHKAKVGARIADPNVDGQTDAFIRSPEFDADRSKQMLGGYMDALKRLINGG